MKIAFAKAICKVYLFTNKHDMFLTSMHASSWKFDNIFVVWHTVCMNTE